MDCARPEVRRKKIGKNPLLGRVCLLTTGDLISVIVLSERSQVEHPLVPPAHLGVACASREEVDRLCALARGEGRLLNGPRDAGPPIGYLASIRDPDGHTLEVSFGQEVGLTVQQAT